MHVDYVCEGCAIPVTWFGKTAAPQHGLCAVCAWLCEFEEPERIMDMRRRCEPGGWISEREQRRERVQ